MSKHYSFTLDDARAALFDEIVEKDYQRATSQAIQHWLFDYWLHFRPRLFRDLMLVPRRRRYLWGAIKMRRRSASKQKPKPMLGGGLGNATVEDRKSVV